MPTSPRKAGSVPERAAGVVALIACSACLLPLLGVTSVAGFLAGTLADGLAIGLIAGCGLVAIGALARRRLRRRSTSANGSCDC